VCERAPSTWTYEALALARTLVPLTLQAVVLLLLLLIERLLITSAGRKLKLQDDKGAQPSPVCESCDRPHL
jgi:hypothetical protein